METGVVKNIITLLHINYKKNAVIVFFLQAGVEGLNILVISLKYFIY